MQAELDMHVVQISITDGNWSQFLFMHLITCCNPSVMHYDAPAIIFLCLLACEGMSLLKFYLLREIAVFPVGLQFVGFCLPEPCHTNGQ